MLTDLHKHNHTYADSHACKQNHSNANRFRQMQTDSQVCKQIHTYANRITQIQTDARIYKQIYIDTNRLRHNGNGMTQIETYTNEHAAQRRFVNLNPPKTLGSQLEEETDLPIRHTPTPRRPKGTTYRKEASDVKRRRRREGASRDSNDLGTVECLSLRLR